MYVSTIDKYEYLYSFKSRLDGLRTLETIRPVA